MRIESGPTGERQIRTLLLFIMLGSFAIWFAYDGWVGYPKKNVKQYLLQLSPEERARVKDPTIYEAVTKEATDAVRAALKEPDTASQRAALEKLFGGPPSFEGEEAWYYFGPAFMVTIPLEGGEPIRSLGSGKPKRRRFIPEAGDKTATDLRWQKGIACVLGVASLILLRRLVHVRRTRLVLEDGGLSYQGKGPIGWDEIKALDITRFQEKGWVDLVYDDNGTERKLRLDEYHLAAFDAVIDEICTRKGFENPLPVRDAGTGKET